jgi:hypothetical protein
VGNAERLHRGSIGSLFGQSSWPLAKSALAGVAVYCLDPWEHEHRVLPIEENTGQQLSLEAFEKNVTGLQNIISYRGHSPRHFVGWERSVAHDAFFDLTNPFYTNARFRWFVPDHADLAVTFDQIQELLGSSEK